MTANQPAELARISAREQFGRAARAYATTRLFAEGEDLALIAREAGLKAGETALDLACGAGHVALALASDGARVIGIDITPQLLIEARRLASNDGISRIELSGGAAEAIPLRSALCDVLTCRYAAHHFPNIALALREMRRVLTPTGRLLIADVVGPHSPALAAWLERIELLRDPSHIRDYSLGEWMGLFERTGFGLKSATTWKLPLEVDAWLSRMNTTPKASDEIRNLFLGADEAATQHFRVRSDGVLRFEFDVALMVAEPR